MNHEDYIKDGDGHKVHINRKGRDMVTQYMAKNGGVTGVFRKTGIHRVALTNFKKNGTCHPETWQKLFYTMYPNLQPAA